jgi:hypothetical protein
LSNAQAAAAHVGQFSGKTGKSKPFLLLQHNTGSAGSGIFRELFQKTKDGL